MIVKIIDTHNGVPAHLEIAFGFIVQSIDLDEAEAAAYRILAAVNAARAREQTQRMAAIAEGHKGQ